MRRTWEKVWRITVALVICIAMLMPSVTTFYATETEVVYDSKDALYAAMRKIFKEKQQGEFEFTMTEELFKQVCEEWYPGQFRFDIYNIFDFYGDQTSIPADEGDYLEQQNYGVLTRSANSYFKRIDISTTGAEYCNTLAQEAAFESKLKSLFASGGALANVKNVTASEKVVACMEYINKNVSSVSTNEALRHTAYSALCEGTATCQGKALLLYRMLRELGIANRILMGMDAAAHTYNIVMIDGTYYYCDPSTTNIILKGSNNFNPATLQEHYQTDAFKAGVLSKISATDYPLKTTTEDNSGTQSGGSVETPSTPPVTTPSTETPSTPPATTPNTDKEETPEEPSSEVTKPVEYKVLDGAESTYEANTQEFSLRAEGELEKFVSVEVDGKEVDKKYYTVKEGSTIVIFTKEFMDTLSEGEHTVKFNFTDGSASTSIKVAASQTPSTDGIEDETTEVVPEEETEDINTNTSEDAKPDVDSDKKDGVPGYVWAIVIIILAAAGAAGVIWYRKKNMSESEE